MYNSIPAIMSMGCTGIGILKAIDGGLAFQKCIDLCASKGTANPSVFLIKWSYSIKKCIKRCTKDALTEIDIKDAKRFLHCSDSSFNEKGKAFKKENAAQVEYAKRMSMLAKRLPTGSINVVTPKSVPSPKSFFLIAHELYLNNPRFNKPFLTAMMHSMVTRMTNPTKNPKMETRALNFFCYLATVSPQAAELVGANLGSAPSKRWMRILNAQERVACAYECQPSDMLKHMLNEVNKRLPTNINGIVSFSIAIDATKVLQLLEISTAFKAIMGGAHPHHLISTIDLDSTTIKHILDHETIFNQADDSIIKNDKASEVKVAFMVFQKPPPGVSPFVIISARPQSNKKCSSSTADIMNAAELVTKKVKSTSFVNFAVDGVSLETKDVMTTICNFLSGRCNFTGAVDNKHNVKNDRYQIIGGSGVPLVGKYVADVNLIQQAGVPENLWIVKDFTSDKKG
jgi:hypothetical protein